MKIKIFAMILAVAVMTFCGFGSAVAEENNLTAQAEFSSSPNADRVLAARLLNMLNHNAVYNDDFSNTNIIVDNSAIMLLDRADQDGFIDSALVGGFVYNMYGISLADYKVNQDLPQKDGFFYVIPRGFDTYSHTITNITRDGLYIYVTSQLVIESHDCDSYTYSCNSVFLMNSASAFGYNLISATTN